MKACRLLLCVLVILACTAVWAENTRKPMPTVMRDIVHGADVVQFVSADEAVSPTGELRADRFHPEVAKVVEGILDQTPESGCIRYGEVWIDRVNVPVRSSVDEAISTAEYVAEGVVTGHEFGFRAGEPGQLLRLSQLKIIYGDGPSTDQLFLFYPVATFKVGARIICKTDWRYGSDVPAEGERVILFALPNQTFGQFVDVIDEAGVIPVRKDGALRLPERLAHPDAPRTLDALRRIIDLPGLKKE
jgi:hypothetical protein